MDRKTYPPKQFEVVGEHVEDVVDPYGFAEKVTINADTNMRVDPYTHCDNNDANYDQLMKLRDRLSRLK